MAASNSWSVPGVRVRGRKSRDVLWGGGRVRREGRETARPRCLLTAARPACYRRLLPTAGAGRAQDRRGSPRSMSLYSGFALCVRATAAPSLGAAMVSVAASVSTGQLAWAHPNETGQMKGEHARRSGCPSAVALPARRPTAGCPYGFRSQGCAPPTQPRPSSVPGLLSRARLRRCVGRRLAASWPPTDRGEASLLRAPGPGVVGGHTPERAGSDEGWQSLGTIGVDMASSSSVLARGCSPTRALRDSLRGRPGDNGTRSPSGGVLPGEGKGGRWKGAHVMLPGRLARAQPRARSAHSCPSFSDTAASTGGATHAG